MIATRLKALTDTIPDTADYLKQSCKTLLSSFQKIESIYKTIGKDNDDENPGVPAFRLPTEHEIGYLVNISVGHTQRPIDVEMTMWALHLKAAGFID